MARKEEMLKASVAYNERNGKIKVFGGSNILSDEEYFAFNKNPDFIAGAEWSDENPKEGLIYIDKACEWLKENTYFYVNDYTGSLNEEKLTEEFRKAMKDKL